MTWVVAHANPMAVVMMSDIRITISGADGENEVREFGVQKIHHVAPTVLAGFAGSIVVGFRLVDDLTAYLGTRFDALTSTITLAEDWATALPSRAPSFVPDALASIGTDVLIAGMHLAPVSDPDGSPTDERMPYGSGCIIRMDHPGTGVSSIARFAWNSAGVSVGSGSVVPEYERMLRELDWIQLSGWDDPATVLGAIMNMTIEATPTPGVSGDLTAMIMKYDGQSIVGAGRTFGKVASDPNLIAESEAELEALLGRFGPPSSPGVAVSTTTRRRAR